MDYITSEGCVRRVKNHLCVETLNLPVFINVNTSHDYKSLKNTLSQLDLQMIRISDYCRNEDGLPDIEKLFHELQNQEKNILLIGLSQYMKLRGKDFFSQKLATLKELSMPQYCLIVLFYQCEDLLSEMLNKDLRLSERIMFVNGEMGKNPCYRILSSELYDSPDHFKEFLKYVENNPELPIKIATKLPFKYFSDRMITVNFISSIYELLLEELAASNFSKYDESFGTKKEWQYLYNQHKKHGRFEKILSEELGGENLYNLFNNWSSFNKNKKWLYWVCLNEKGDNGSYLSLAAIKAKKAKDFEKCIFQTLLDISLEDEKYWDYYFERKGLIQAMDKGLLKSQAENYSHFASSKDEKALNYLTDLTDPEKQSIITCLAKYDYNRDELMKVLKKIYPDLASYLAPFNFKYDFLTHYFQEYKFQKIANRISPDFIKLVNEYSRERSYNKVLPARMTALEKINHQDAEVYFFDALGVEYLAYIMAKSNELGLFVNVTICRANLPTITEMNKDFLNLFENVHSIKLLDKVKHSGDGDYNYNKTKLPIHLCRELEIIEEFLNKARSKLSEKDKVIVISDHGASRLAIINDERKTVDLGSKGSHGGRCCKYSDEIEKIEEAVEENGYYVIGNYDKIKGGRIGRVETHGGGTLEEVIIPILEFRLKDKEINVFLKEKVIKTSFRKEGKLIMISDYKLKRPTLQINDMIIELEKEENYQYYFNLTKLKKPGDYIAGLYDSNNFIANLSFTIIKEGSVEKELF
jgi:hypothetical protein